MCEWTKPDSQFGAQRHYRRGGKPCDDCLHASRAYYRNRSAALRAEGKDFMRHPRWRTIWSKYRLRPHEHAAILARQEGVCAICQTSAATHIDHDHACAHPGRGTACCAECVRGILCNRCNLGIAILDDVEWLKKALDYLGREDVAEIIRQSRLW